jgi:hypothetical protein
VVQDDKHVKESHPMCIGQVKVLQDKVAALSTDNARHTHQLSMLIPHGGCGMIPRPIFLKSSNVVVR